MQSASVLNRTLSRKLSRTDGQIDRG